MNQEQFDKFIDNVKAGKVPGLRADSEGKDVLIRDEHYASSYACWIGQDDSLQETDWLCAAIRRALTAMGWRFGLHEDELSISFWNCQLETYTKIEEFSEGAELDWHLAAINFAVEQGETK